MYKRTEDDMDKEEIKVLIVRPEKEPEKAQINNDLRTLRHIVNGHLEAVKPPSHTDDTIILCNEEGKFNGSAPNRPLFDEFGRCFDIIYGTFLVCRHPAGSEELSSMTDDQLEKYRKIYSFSGEPGNLGPKTF